MGKYDSDLKPVPEIKDVIFNEPDIIVFWHDGTKTVVKAQDNDIFDPEKGLAMAIAKKAFGNESNYCNKLKPWLEEHETQQNIISGMSFKEVCERASESIKNIAQALRKNRKQNNVEEAYNILRDELNKPKYKKDDLVFALIYAITVGLIS